MTEDRPVSTPPARTGSRRRARGILVAIGVAVAAVAIGLVAGMLIGAPREQGPIAGGSVAPSTEPSVAPSEAAPTEDPTVEPTEVPPTPSPTPAPVRLGEGAVARVTVSALNIREAADATSAHVATLASATELYVTGEYVEAGEFVWYPVAAATEPDQSACVSGCDARVSSIGWVATPATGSEAWIQESIVACPTEPFTVDKIIPLTPFERLQCFANREFVATGWADNACCGFVGPYTFEPVWLAYPSSIWFRGSDFYSLLTYSLFNPDGTSDLYTPTPGDIVRFTAHFDDPAAPDCRVEVAEEGVASEFPNSEIFTFECRLKLVVTEYEVIGHEGEGVCGCLQPPSPTPAATMPRGGIRV